MKLVLLPIIAFALSGPADAQRQSAGLFHGWAAFAEQRPQRCYAIAQPQSPKAAAGGASASVGHWPGRGPGAQMHVRLSGQRRPGSAILLRIDGRAFQMIGDGRNAWAPDRRADAAIVAAMRTGLAMTVETRTAQGTRLRDRYSLRGAASAIDAAVIACAQARGRR